MRNENAECRSYFGHVPHSLACQELGARKRVLFEPFSFKKEAGFSICLITLLLLALSGCAVEKAPALMIVGDCQGYTLTSNAALEDAIAQARPTAEQFDILLIGADGLISRISGKDMDGCALVYAEENAWELKSELHPPSARVKELALVAVVRDSEDTRTFQRLLKEEGSSQKNGRSVTVYTTLMITETFSDTLRFLEQGERVMVIELDGLGWEMLEKADAPVIHALEPLRAMAAYPPISPVGLASMLTGRTPAEHGVRDRETREMAAGDLFSMAAKMGKTSAYIEGNHALLNTSLKPVLSLNDGEVLANAQAALEGQPDLVFVHFHEIDEAAHEYGPYAPQTMEKIKEIDGYVQALCDAFDGCVIITADHGLHAAEDGGAHGSFTAEDMFVPYIINEK